MNSNSITLHVAGMHCKSCEVLIESELRDMPNVSRAIPSLASQRVTIEGDFGDASKEAIAQEINAVLTKHGYTVSAEPHRPAVAWSEFKLAIPLAIIVVALFFTLQKLGIVNLIGSGGINFSTAFVVGIVASLSTCMAVVGGLVLSMSATFSKSGNTVRPHLLFHLARVVSFFVLGGVVGYIGSAFRLSGMATLILSLVVAGVMALLGINLLDIFRGTKRMQLTMPKLFSSHAIALSNMNHWLTPALVGAITFFLPCGFTQSMQMYALSTGSFAQGSLIMGFFALGTLPVLLALSFSANFIHGKKNRGVFFKTVGFVVILFALVNVLNGLAAAGIIEPLLNI